MKCTLKGKNLLPIGNLYIIVPKSGHATVYVERFVYVILRKLGPFALRIGETHSVWCIFLSVKGLCALYTLRIWALWC